MKNIRLLYFILMMILTGCDVLDTPVFQNPNDPVSDYFSGEAPSHLRVITLADSIIKLSWDNNSNAMIKNIIQRKSGDGAYSDIGIIGGSDSAYIDTLTFEQGIYSYRVKSVSRADYSSVSEAVRIKMEYYMDTLKIFDDTPAFILSPDHNLMAVMKYGYENIIYDITNDYKVVSRFNGSPGIFAFTSNNRDIACDNVVNNQIEIRDVLSGAVLKTMSRIYDVNAVGISPDDKYLITTDLFYTYIWDLKTAVKIKEVKNLYWNSSPVKFVFSNDGKYLACINSGPSITLRETGLWNVTNEIGSTHGSNAYFSLDNRFMLYSASSVWAAWDLSGSEVRKQKFTNTRFFVAPDERSALVYIDSYYSEYIELWEMRGLNPSAQVLKIPMVKGFKDAVISKHGEIFLINKENQLIIWSVGKRWITFQ